MILYQSISLCVWALVLLTTAESWEMGETQLFCKNRTGKSPIPALTVTFPDQFQVSIEAVYYTNESQPRFSDAVQSIDKKTGVNAVSRFENGVGYQYIFNTTTKKYTFVNNSQTCVGDLAYNSTTDPLLFPNNATAGWLNNSNSILDIWAWATKDSKAIYNDTTGGSHHEHGIPVDHYYVCKDVGEYTLEVEICITSNSVKMPFPDVNGSLPVRIDVKRYETKQNSTSIEEFVGYRLSSYQTLPEEKREEAFLPPPGLPCTNISAQSGPALPKIATSFGVKINYVDQTDRRIDVGQLHINCDDPSRVLSFEYTHNDTDIPLAEHVAMPAGKVRIVHDFIYGLEYTIDMTEDKCVNVSDIPADAADAYNKQGKLSMKDSSQILGIQVENGSFYYVGQRFLESGLPADVWLTYTGEKSNETVREVYFSLPGWKIHGSTAESTIPTLLALKTYHWTGTKNPIVTTQRFYDLETYPNKDMQWKMFDVSPCLQVSKNDSYLVAIGNDTMQNIDKIGRGRIENVMRQKLADAAGVSPLRVTNFYFESVNNTFWVFFFIAERANINGSETEWHKDSITAEEARATLNKTLLGNALVVEVALDGGKKYVVNLNKGSLAAVPPFFTAPTETTIISGSEGYSGGSMAALGICMLLIGGVLGLGLAFFMWKRNRGIAYQIYE